MLVSRQALHGKVKHPPRDRRFEKKPIVLHDDEEEEVEEEEGQAEMEVERKASGPASRVEERNGCLVQGKLGKRRLAREACMLVDLVSEEPEELNERNLQSGVQQDDDDVQMLGDIEIRGIATPLSPMEHVRGMYLKGTLTGNSHLYTIIDTEIHQLDLIYPEQHGIIGSGSFAQVYKAKYRGEDIAVKHFKPNEKAEKIENEIVILRSKP